MEKTESAGAKFLKETFAKQAEKYQHHIDNQLDNIKQNAGFIGTVAIATGLAFAGVYYAARSFSKKDIPAHASSLPALQKPKPEMHPVLRIFWENISVFLLAIAREKLVAYLRKVNETEEEKPEEK